jgi:RNA polymerase sigma factor (sigma-70 family)
VLAGEPDERLVALVRAGDERAFAAIVERYRAPLLRYCRSRLPPAAAEDALQQTFINAYSALSGDGAQAPVSLRPWLYRVAHNAALNVARDPQARLARLHDGIDGVERPGEVVARSERLWRVVGAVRALPPKQRDVIVRHAVDGQSHERIAADLGVSAGSIRQLAHRARRTVREAAAALVPVGVVRWLPWGTGVAESAPAAGGGGAVVKVAVAVVVASAAGGGAAEVARRADDRPERRAVAARSDRPDRVPAAGAAATRAPARAPVRAVAPPTAGESGGLRERRRPSARRDSSGSGPAGAGFDSSGSGTSVGGGTSGSGTSGGGDSSGSGSSGDGGFDSSGSGSSGSGSSGSGSSGSGSSGSGSGSVPAVPVETETAIGPDSSGPGSGDSELSDSGSGGSGSSGSGSSGSGSSGSG